MVFGWAIGGSQALDLLRVGNQDLYNIFGNVAILQCQKICRYVVVGGKLLRCLEAWATFATLDPGQLRWREA